MADEAERDAKDKQTAFDNQMILARENNASRESMAKLQRDFIASQKEADRKNRLAMAELSQTSKPLPPAIIKAEDADYEQATAAINLANEADKYLSIIRSGEIKFGPLDRALISIRSATGSEDAQVVARNDFERFRTRLINESLRLNKGTQTDSDAQRATNELKSAESMADAGKSIETLRRINADRARDAYKSITGRRANNKLPPPETVIEIPKFDPQAFTDAEEKRILNDPKIPAGTIYINAKGQRMTKTQASR